MLACRWFERTHRVSKNVCHGVVYDRTMHERLMAVKNPHPGLLMVIRGMESYLQRRPQGKKFHDPLAVMCALDPSIGVWERVEPYREWGCRKSDDPNAVKIIVHYDHEKFVAAMIGSPT